MKKGKVVLAPRPVAAMLQRRADRRLREIASNSDIAERHVFEELGTVAATILGALSPEQRVAAALGVFERLLDGMSADDATAWLGIQLQKQHATLELKAIAASETDAGRRRGGAASVAIRQVPWNAWRSWICTHFNVDDAAKVPSADRTAIITVISYRAGVKIRRPALDKSVPTELPALKGRNGQPPSDDTIRRKLFDSRAK
jgi:hypothetical protein